MEMKDHADLHPIDNAHRKLITLLVWFRAHCFSSFACRLAKMSSEVENDADALSALMDAVDTHGGDVFCPPADLEAQPLFSERK